MKVFRIVSTVFWLLLIMIACNTTPENTASTAEKAEEAAVSQEELVEENTVVDLASENLPASRPPQNSFFGELRDFKELQNFF